MTLHEKPTTPFDIRYWQKWLFRMSFTFTQDFPGQKADFPSPYDSYGFAGKIKAKEAYNRPINLNSRICFADTDIPSRRKLPSRTRLNDLWYFRTTVKIMPTANSATESGEYAGTRTTLIPKSFAFAMSTLLNPAHLNAMYLTPFSDNASRTLRGEQCVLDYIGKQTYLSIYSVVHKYTHSFMPWSQSCRLDI